MRSESVYNSNAKVKKKGWDEMIWVRIQLLEDTNPLRLHKRKRLKSPLVQGKGKLCHVYIDGGFQVYKALTNGRIGI